LEALASFSRYTAYLIMRSGSDAVCLDRIQSDPPVKTSPFGIGGRRPLGIGAGGIAILASMGDAEIRRALNSNRRDLESYGRVSIPSVWRAVERARTRKFAFTKNIHTYGVSSIGVLIRGRGLPADYAVSLLTDETLTEKRVHELFRAMTSEIRKMKF
jgi:DNA-binding IclR family transcriptional regulator